MMSEGRLEQLRLKQDIEKSKVKLSPLKRMTTMSIPNLSSKKSMRFSKVETLNAY